jgi:hypothetical protein
MPDSTNDGLLAGFTAARPYTMEAAAGAPSSPGVHVVLEHDVVVHVGWTGDLRRRLRQHLTGNRGSSVLHDQVGQELDAAAGNPASASDIAGWLGRRTVRWHETDNPQGTKEALVVALQPRFNRQRAPARNWPARPRLR